MTLPHFRRAGSFASFIAACFAIGIGVLLGSCSFARANQERTPNIVLIMADDKCDTMTR